MIIYDLMMIAYVYEMDINSYLHYNLHEGLNIT
jgi:hypothetical protein